MKNELSTEGTIARKQRLRTLENHIRKAADSVLSAGLGIGKDLCEIRDEELWREEFTSWNQYLTARAQELVGRSASNCKSLVQSAETAKRLPSGAARGLKYRHLVELSRLAPNKQGAAGRGREKDYAKLKKADVSRVLKAAAGASGDQLPSVRDIRKAVDNELGIDRAANTAATKEKREASDKPLIEDYLRGCLGRIEGMIGHLEDVPGESWTLLEETDPGLAARVAEACDLLAGLLRS